MSNYDKPTKKHRALFARLCVVEPRLTQLLKEAQSIEDDGKQPSFCGNDIWYDKFKERMSLLVGWEPMLAQGKEILCTEQAYDAAYLVLYDALPDCRNCLCL